MLKELNVIHDEESHETKYFLKQYDEEEQDMIDCKKIEDDYVEIIDDEQSVIEQFANVMFMRIEQYLSINNKKI